MVRFAQRVTHARGIPTRGEPEFPPYTLPGSRSNRTRLPGGRPVVPPHDDGRRLSAKPASQRSGAHRRQLDGRQDDCLRSLVYSASAVSEGSAIPADEASAPAVSVHKHLRVLTRAHGHVSAKHLVDFLKQFPASQVEGDRTDLHPAI